VTLKKIGLLGGTFDPVHYGHLQLAQSALEECGLDKVVFIPSAQPPHKNGLSITPFMHRMAMLTLAGGGISDFECNPIEATLPRPSYTIDTLRELRKHYTGSCRLYFMIGADAFLDILTWKSYQEVLHSVNIILSRRKGYSGGELAVLLKKLGYKADEGSWHGDDGKKDIYILKKIPDDHSSSAIRAMIENGESVQQFLPRSVIEYIQNNKLYQSKKAAKNPGIGMIVRDKC
jgi:nicotinate-nucleotide adenylyltransferase